jgi:signal transduction histidine kinase
MDVVRILLSNLSLNEINAYTALVAAIINFSFALFTIARTAKEMVYITFSLVCFCVAWWNFCDFMVFASGHSMWLPSGTLIETTWKNLVPVGSALAVAFLFHFTVALVGRRRKNRFWIVLVYVFAICIGTSPLVAPFSETVMRFWTGKGWNLTFFIFLFPFLLASIIMIAAAFVKARVMEERGWLKFILAAIILQTLAGMTHLFHKIIPSLPPLGHLGNVIGPMILATGVFKHRKAFDILVKTQKKLDLISETAAEIAHEIKSPLSAIRGLTQLQADMDKEEDMEKIRQYQSIVNEEIQRIDGILSGLQDFTKPLTMDRKQVDINDVVRKIVKLIELENTGPKITLNLDVDLPKVEADPSLLKQVILNLIRNANEACGQDGNLEIRTARQGDYIRIEFTDDGPGIPEEIRPRILEAFFTTKETGLGLGLAVVGKIVDTHGGEIHIDNVTEGGTRVTIRIPR